jgi:hypothetical protein
MILQQPPILIDRHLGIIKLINDGRLIISQVQQVACFKIDPDDICIFQINLR